MRQGQGAETPCCLMVITFGRQSGGKSSMRVVVLEEHFAVPALSARISKDIISRRGYRPRNLSPGAPNPLELLPEIGEIRLKSMDDAGITVQVLSNSGDRKSVV